MARKAATVATEPSAACLTFSFPPELLGEHAAEQIRAHYRTCTAFEQRWADLTDRRQTLLEQSRDIVFGVLCDTAAELVAERVQLQAQLDQLFAARRELCESLLGAAAVAVAAGKDAHDQVLAFIAAELAQKGITAESYPGYGANPQAGHRQFKHRVETDDAAVASLGRLRRIESAAGAVAAVAEAGDVTVALRWPGANRDHKPLAEFLKLEDDQSLYALRLSGGRFA